VLFNARSYSGFLTLIQVTQRPELSALHEGRGGGLGRRRGLSLPGEHDEHDERERNDEGDV
jgi:hypothetical protein